MRWVTGVVVMAGMMFGVVPGSVPNAFAGDFDVLRGSESVGPALYPRWTGFYAGGQVGYSNTGADFSQATSSLVAYSLRELALENDSKVSTWQVLGEGSTSAASYGAFVGYNSQWQDLILSVEANYNRTSTTVVAPVSPIGRVTSAGGNTYDVDLTGAASLKLIDYGTLRARAGLSMGSFLPYMFGGFALGRSDYTRSSLVSGQENPSSPPIVPCDHVAAPSCVDFAFSNSESKSSALMYGFTVGGGLDVAITPNVFVRGEFEYVRFAPVGDILVSVTSARIGAGVKF
jgi:opacity protein-like surface antigen